MNNIRKIVWDLLFHSGEYEESEYDWKFDNILAAYKYIQIKELIDTTTDTNPNFDLSNVEKDIDNDANFEDIGKVYFCNTFCTQTTFFYQSKLLFKKYPNQTRVKNIDECDAFAFTCYEAEKHHDKTSINMYADVYIQLIYALKNQKRIIPVTIGYAQNNNRHSGRIINEHSIWINKIIPIWDTESILLNEKMTDKWKDAYIKEIETTTNTTISKSTTKSITNDEF